MSFIVVIFRFLETPTSLFFSGSSFYNRTFLSSLARMQDVTGGRGTPDFKKDATEFLFFLVEWAYLILFMVVFIREKMLVDNL